MSTSPGPAITEGPEIRVTARDVQDYAETAQDFNPLHVDREAAARLGLAECVVPGGMITALMEQVIWLTFDDPEIREIRTRFVGTVFVNQSVVCSGRIARTSATADGIEYTLRLLCRTPDRKIVCMGDALVVVRAVEPDQ